MVKLVFVLLKVRMTNSGRKASRKNVYYAGAMGRLSSINHQSENLLKPITIIR